MTRESLDIILRLWSDEPEVEMELLAKEVMPPFKSLLPK